VSLAALIAAQMQRGSVHGRVSRPLVHQLLGCIHVDGVAGFDLGNQLSKTDTRTHLAAVWGVADAAPALLKPSSHRWWLGLNIVGALALNHLILTNWRRLVLRHGRNG
jgi:hypothetical protein